MTKSLLHHLTVAIFLAVTGALSASAADPGRSPRQSPSRQHTPHPAQVCIQVYEFNSVDVQPQFPGGDVEMVRFINHERRYPTQAYHEGIQGRVLCSFVVNEDGALSHISVIKGVEESLDREAVRIISKMPKWSAGSVSDERVPVYCILPITFRR